MSEIGGFGRAVGSGMAWSVATAVGRRAVSTGVFIVLARLLVPADFGLVALAAVFVAILALVRDQGLVQAVVQRRDLEALHLDTALIFAAAAGAVLAGAVAAASPLVSAVMNEPDLTPILIGLSPALLFGGLRSVPTALLLRNLQMRSLAARELIGVTTGGVAGVAAALAGWGAWALVTQTMVDSAVGAALLWYQIGWRPHLRFSRRHFRDLFGFSVNILGIQMLNQTFRRSDDLLVGAVLGPTVLGLYAVAYRLFTITSEVFLQSLGKVAFPAFSQLQHDGPRLERALTRTVRLSSTLTVPAFVGMAVVSPELIVFVFGSEWRHAGSIASVLALGGIGLPLWTVQTQLLNAKGRPNLALRAHFWNAGISLAGFAAAVSHGVLVVAWVFTIRSVVVLPIAGRFTKRVTGIGLRTIVGACRAAIVAGLVMAATGFGARMILEDASDLVVALGAGAAAALSYLAVLLVGFPAILREMWALLNSIRPHRAPDDTVMPGADHAVDHDRATRHREGD